LEFWLEEPFEFPQGCCCGMRALISICKNFSKKEDKSLTLTVGEVVG
jgi:hypothetical protein